jgi:hypothetical protein
VCRVLKPIPARCSARWDGRGSTPAHTMHSVHLLYWLQHATVHCTVCSMSQIKPCSHYWTTKGTMSSTGTGVVPLICCSLEAPPILLYATCLCCLSAGCQPGYSPREHHPRPASCLSTTCTLCWHKQSDETKHHTNPAGATPCRNMSAMSQQPSYKPPTGTCQAGIINHAGDAVCTLPGIHHSRCTHAYAR